MYWTGRWVDSTACLDIIVKRKISCSYQDSNSDSPVVSQAKSLHHLCCPRYCYEIWRNITSLITASVTVGYCSLPLNGEGIFVPSNLKFVTFFMTQSHLHFVRYLWQVFKGRCNGDPISPRLSGLMLYCLLYPWICSEDSDDKPWLLAARSDLDSWQGQWEYFFRHVWRIYTEPSVCICVCVCVFLYNRLYFRWWKENEDHHWQCLLCITCTASTRLFLVWWSWNWSVLLYITPKPEKAALVFEFWKPAEIESLLFDILQLLQGNSGTAFIKADYFCFFPNISQTLSHLTFDTDCNILTWLRNRS
jgi:hypothetical protein